jgi:hypothetical protein
LYAGFSPYDHNAKIIEENMTGEPCDSANDPCSLEHEKLKNYKKEETCH